MRGLGVLRRWRRGICWWWERECEGAEARKHQERVGVTAELVGEPGTEPGCGGYGDGGGCCEQAGEAAVVASAPPVGRGRGLQEGEHAARHAYDENNDSQQDQPGQQP